MCHGSDEARTYDEKHNSHRHGMPKKEQLD